MEILRINANTSSKSQQSCQDRLLDLVDWLIHNVQGDLGDRWLKEVRELLESLPLSTSEFDLACRRINNATRYLKSVEYGAARFELRLLRGSLLSA